MALRRYCLRYIGLVCLILLVHYLGLHLSVNRLPTDIVSPEGVENLNTYYISGHASKESNNRISSESISMNNTHSKEERINTNRFPWSNSLDQLDLDAGFTKQNRQFSCSNIGDIVLKRKLRETDWIELYEGLYKGQTYLIKLVHQKEHILTDCLRLFVSASNDNHQICQSLGNAKLMTDILMSQQLSHSNLLPLLGFCVNGRSTNSPFLKQTGLISVYRGAVPFDMRKAESLPWNIRFNIVTGLLDLLDYLQRSRLGNLLIWNLDRGDFVMTNTSVDLFNLSDLTSDDLQCAEDKITHYNETTIQQSCPYGIKCKSGLCPRYNNVQNLFKIKAILLQRLLRTRDTDLNREIRKLWINIEKYPTKYSARLVKRELEEIYRKMFHI